MPFTKFEFCRDMFDGRMGIAPLQGVAMTGLVLIVPLIFTAAGDARPTVLVVAGAHGAPDYRAPFQKQVDRWADAAARGGATLISIGSGPLCRSASVIQLVTLNGSVPR